MITTQKIIITTIALLLLGGVVVFWMIFTSASSTGSSLSGDNSGSGYINITNLNQGGDSSTQSGTSKKKTAGSTSNIDELYQQIFLRLSANFPEFIKVTSTTGSYGSIYALYASDVADAKKLYPTASQYAVEVTSVDLNGDATNEVIVSESLPGFCGTNGCPLDIYRNKNGQWTKISSLLSSGAIGLENVSTAGYRNLFVTTQDEETGVFQIWRYVWDGAQYQTQKTVAVWTGSGFVLP